MCQRIPWRPCYLTKTTVTSHLPYIQQAFFNQRHPQCIPFRPITSTLFTTGALRPIPIPAATRRRNARAGGCLTRTSLTSLRRHWGFSLSSRGLLLGPRDVRPRARSHFLFLARYRAREPPGDGARTLGTLPWTRPLPSCPRAGGQATWIQGGTKSPGSFP